ncbi:MAG: L,D-transpeptidase [Lachnospiraceae bacterium]|nr:L,D-transpeptidase [Lachnospiraceae bacterium]
MKNLIKKLIILCFGIFILFQYKMTALAEESSSDTRPDYAIYVNRTENVVTVMEQQADGTSVVAKVMVCSCGAIGHETPEGTFYTSDYYDWRILVDGSYGRYAVRFNGHILFHSVPYIEPRPDTLEWELYNQLGENASMGCVRLMVEDIKWIHDNCKVGTPVVVYSGNTIVGDVTKPTAPTIAEDSPCRGWDPTDTDSNNPWLGGPGLTSQTGSLDTFDHTAYADRYPDVKAAFGYDKAALYDHYMTYGINEGRVAEFSEGSKTFDYIAYASRYADLKEAFGYNRTALYQHYITYGIDEGRIAEFY